MTFFGPNSTDNILSFKMIWTSPLAHLLSEVNSEIFRNQNYFRFFPKYLNPRRKIIGKMVKIPS
jgi:hypothetical protein